MAGVQAGHEAGTNHIALMSPLNKWNEGAEPGRSKTLMIRFLLDSQREPRGSTSQPGLLEAQSLAAALQMSCPLQANSQFQQSLQMWTVQ